MTRKWIHLIWLAAALLLYLTSCGPNSGTEGQSHLQTTEPDTFAYQHLLPDSVQVLLPKIEIDSSVQQNAEHPSVPVFLGFRAPTEDSPYTQHIALELGTYGGQQFLDIPTWSEAVFAAVPDSLRSRIWVDLWVDGAMPYFALHYLEAHLRKHNLQRIKYRNAAGMQLPVRLPPFEENQCSQLSGRSCLRKQLISPAALATLKYMELGADWAPTLRYEGFVLRPENVFDLRVEPDDLLLKKGQPLSTDSLYKAAYDFLTGPGAATKKIFKVRVADKATYAHFLRANSTLKLVYQDVWEAAAQRMYNKTYNDLERAELIQVKNKWPIVIWLDKK